MATITFLVHGKPADPEPTAGASREFLKDMPGAKVKQSVKVGTVRGSDAGVLLEAEAGKDVVVIHIADGPSLILHPDNARDLLLAQEGAPATSRDGSTASTAYLPVPPSLSWAIHNTPVQKRGIVEKVVVAGIDVLTGVSSDSVAALAAGAVVMKVDGQVDPGVYKLAKTGLEPLKGSRFKISGRIGAPAPGQPLLVLVHGTFSDTSGTFGKLWQHKPLLDQLFDRYDQQVYALDHPTLGESPINNALLLARTLPNGARLHLLTHSRGGLVAEVLARACSLDALQQQDLDFFAGQAQDGTELAELVALLKQEDIRVERIVRVACPARGTLLASKRLDAYLSVLKWTLDIAQIPVLPGLVGFLGDVARNKSDPDKIPGLAAQMPDSPLVRWLHAADQPVAGQLRVVAGDVQGDSIGSWIKTLLTDAYYWTDNDFVVQTSSMYGGTPRAGGASFLLDKGSKVSHFTYFSNPGTAKSIVQALTLDEPEGFRAIGPLSAAGKDSSGTRAAPPAPNLKRPLVFILPGIMGSHLKVDGRRIWLGAGMLNGFDRLAYDAQDTSRVVPDGAVGLAYEDLARTLRLTQDVKEFAFDWRKPIEVEARRLALAIENELNLREKTQQPVRLLAHSMGGLLARVMQLEAPEVWARMITRPGASVLMLGTPNGGSWAPMQMLSGDDSFGNALVAFGSPFRDGEARALVANFPGFLQLQAGLLDPRFRLGDEATWVRLAEEDSKAVQHNSKWHSAILQLRSFEWGVPPQSVLSMAVELRKRLDAQRDSGAFNAKGKVAMVLGRARFTPDGYTLQNGGLLYLDAPDQGDGRVTLESALLPGVPAWQVNAEHGKLPSYQEAYRGYVELLETGTTTVFGRQLDPDEERRRNADRSQLRSNRGARRAPSGPPGMIPSIDGDAGSWPDVDTAPIPLKLSVINGNLKFVRQPVILGHYSSSMLTGAEEVMNNLIGGSMSASITMGLYPDAIATHQIFVNLGEDGVDPLRLPRPESVIVVGLGPEGELTADTLSATVRGGVIGWAQRLAERNLEKLDMFELAATLIGSGGPGISAALAARSIAQGISDANQQLRHSPWPQVSHLHLTELYLDRATDAWRALRLLAAATPGSYEVAPCITPGTGALQRALATGYRGASYDIMSAVSENSAGKPDAVITYTLDTKRAREDVRAQGMQGPLIKMLLASASNGNYCDQQLGKTLFKLLVPPEVEPFMAGTSDLQLSLDSGTAGIPWEMLDTNAYKNKDSGQDNQPRSADTPWAIRVKLLRRLRTVEPGNHLADAAMGGATLVIGEPACGSGYPRLPGAWREARAVADTIRRAMPDADITELISPVEGELGFDAPRIINTVFERDWRVVHIAGHGALPSQQDHGGVVLSGGTFLGPNEIATLRVVPALVFVNCCHLGSQDPNALLKGDADRPTQAANLAQELIKKGVRCVIVAGWAVDDDAAEIFAAKFYSELVQGQRFIDAVAAARTSAWMHDKNGKTWAAYQCYGDPNWYWERTSDPAKPVVMPIAEEFDGIGSPRALVLALENVAIDARYKDQNSDDCYNKVRYLEKTFRDTWPDVGMVAEAFGMAWAEAREPLKAIEWNRKAVKANDGSAAIQALEQLGNALVVAAWEAVCVVIDDTSAQPSGSQRAEELEGPVRYALANLKEAVTILEKLNAIQPNVERQSLLASAYKRIAMVHKVDGSVDKAIQAVCSMRQHYDAAVQSGRNGAATDWFYPALNRVGARLIAYLHGKDENPFDSPLTDELVRGLEQKIHAEPDFQAVVARIQLSLYEALANHSVPRDMTSIVAKYEDLFLRAKAPRCWNSVRDQFDFLLLFCKDVITGEPLSSCQLLHERLSKIAPRPRAGSRTRNSVTMF